MYGKEIYYRTAHDDGDTWLSVSGSAYVGFYVWKNATTFNCAHGHLYSDYNRQKLSFCSDSDQYLCCWNEYPQLRVEFVELLIKRSSVRLPPRRTRSLE